MKVPVIGGPFNKCYANISDEIKDGTYVELNLLNREMNWYWPVFEEEPDKNKTETYQVVLLKNLDPAAVLIHHGLIIAEAFAMLLKQYMQ